MVLIDNEASTFGGGIGIFNGSCPILRNVCIRNNTSGWSGGGVYCVASMPRLENVTIRSNDARYFGGGLSVLLESLPRLVAVNIRGNKAESGGGLFIQGAGYIGAEPAKAYFDDVSVTHNSAYEEGGGIYFSYYSDLEDVGHNNRIYSNVASVGRDLFAESDDSNRVFTMQLDSFTVLFPTDYYALPSDKFILEVRNYITEQITTDVFISPVGSDTNTGTDPDHALRTIGHAMSVLYSDSLNPVTVYLADGTYSHSSTGEVFPIRLLRNMVLQGETTSGTILSAERNAPVFIFERTRNQTLKNITISDGDKDLAGGIICFYTENLTLKNVVVSDNYGSEGAGIFCLRSSLDFSAIVIRNNTSTSIGGGAVIRTSEAKLAHSDIRNNDASFYGGGLVVDYGSNLTLRNVTVKFNHATEYGGGMVFGTVSSVIFDAEVRCNIFSNESIYGRDFYSHDTSTISIFADTLSVMNPTDYYAFPMGNYTFDAKTYIQEQLCQDLYVSPDGSDDQLRQHRRGVGGQRDS